MSDQATFFEPLRRKRRKITAPDKIATKIGTLAEWYRANKPEVKCIRISSDDAFSLRQMWNDETSRQQVRMAGFNVLGSSISWRGFDLMEAA